MKIVAENLMLCCGSELAGARFRFALLGSDITEHSRELHLATLRTINVSFEGIGGSPSESRAALICALQQHADDYQLSLDWYKKLEGGIQITRMPGSAKNLSTHFKEVVVDA